MKLSSYHKESQKTKDTELSRQEKRVKLIRLRGCADDVQTDMYLC